jgi:hypothetical protein
MTRVPGRPNAVRGPSRMARAKFRKHKVIVESITQARKKLRIIVCCRIVPTPVKSRSDHAYRSHLKLRHHKGIHSFPRAIRSLLVLARRGAGKKE